MLIFVEGSAKMVSNLQLFVRFYDSPVSFIYISALCLNTLQVSSLHFVISYLVTYILFHIILVFKYSVLRLTSKNGMVLWFLTPIIDPTACAKILAWALRSTILKPSHPKSSNLLSSLTIINPINRSLAAETLWEGTRRKGSLHLGES